jgi:poly-gamma-glutamate synthesis protein (capsule biosynthesis protein)
VRILFAGDVMLGRRMAERLPVLGPAWPWGDLLPVFSEATLRVVNLECVLARGGVPHTPETKEFHFRADPAHAAVLAHAGISAVSLANNHAGDFGKDALVETLDALDAAGVAHAGAGRDEEEAWRPAMLAADGLRVALLAFTDHERTWAAGPRTPGTAACRAELRDPRCQRLLRAVREARRAADVVVVSAHWGGNWGRVPEPNLLPLARALVECGADVVHGHSSHVLRGIGTHRGRPVLYGCGGLVDDYTVVPEQRNDRSAVFTVAFDGRVPARVRARPIVIRDLQARLAPEDEARTIGTSLVALSSPLGTVARYDPVRREVVVAL